MPSVSLQNSLADLVLVKGVGTVYFGERHCARKLIDGSCLIKEYSSRIREAGARAFLVLPNIVREKDFPGVCSVVSKNLEHLDGIVSADYGICRNFCEKCEVVYEGRVFNSLFIEQLIASLKVKRIRVFPPYLNLIKKLKKNRVAVEIYAHGFIPVGSSAECLTSSLYGCAGCGKRSVIKNSYGSLLLSGNTFHTSLDISCREVLDQLDGIGVDSVVIDTYGKDASEVGRLVSIYSGKADSDKKAYCNGIFLGDESSSQISGIWQARYRDLARRLSLTGPKDSNV